jgi:hypothetical protein
MIDQEQVKEALDGIPALIVFVRLPTTTRVLEVYHITPSFDFPLFDIYFENGEYYISDLFKEKEKIDGSIYDFLVDETIRRGCF